MSLKYFSKHLIWLTEIEETLICRGLQRMFLKKYFFSTSVKMKTSIIYAC